MSATIVSPALLNQLFDCVDFSLRKCFRAAGVIVPVPQIGAITGSCESIDTTYGVEAGGFVIQTGQLALEVALQYHDWVATVVCSARNERADARHLPQFPLAEEEIAWSRLLDHAETAPSAVLSGLISRVEEVVKYSIGAVCSEFPEVLKKLGRLDELAACVEQAWPIVTYDEALAAIRSSKMTPPDRYPLDPAVPHDFDARDESLIVDIFGRGRLPIFVTCYPTEIKFFNMKTDPKDRTRALSLDLLMPIAGEAVGGAVREEDPGRLRQRLDDSRMLMQYLERGGRKDDFSAYFRIMEAGMVPPHAGYGLGVDRLMQYILGADDIRTVGAMYRLGVMAEWF